MNATKRKSLLIVWHSRTGTAQQMAQAAELGAQLALKALEAEDAVQVHCMPADAVHASHMLASDAYVFAAPENLAALSGTMKEFFDRNYYALLDKLNGRPYALLIAAGSDGSNAAKQAERIATGWRLRRALPTVIVNTHAQTPEAIAAQKTLLPADHQACQTTGGTLAALLA